MGRPKGFNREEVLEKAMPVFWKHGFADTSLQDLERATGVNKSGLYTKFRDKEDLFVACLRHYLESQGKRRLLTKEFLGWNNVEAFLKNGPLNKGSSRGVFPSTPCEQWSRIFVRGQYVALTALHEQHKQFAIEWDTNLRLQGFLYAYERQPTTRA